MWSSIPQIAISISGLVQGTDEVVGKRPSAALPLSPALLILVTRDGGADLTGQVTAAYFYQFPARAAYFLMSLNSARLFLAQASSSCPGTAGLSSP